MIVISTFLMALSAGQTFAELPKVKCDELVIVELTVHDQFEPNVPRGAFISDSRYLGVGTNAIEAESNAIRACEEGKWPTKDCQSATRTQFSMKDEKYREAAKTLSGCSDEVS